MRRLFLTAFFLLSATGGSFAQDFNPGTVVGNVFQNPLSGCGYGYGLGCYPPDYDRDRGWAYHHRHARRRVQHDAGIHH
jgi:hypothetical protein